MNFYRILFMDNKILKHMNQLYYLIKWEIKTRILYVNGISIRNSFENQYMLLEGNVIYTIRGS